MALRRQVFWTTTRTQAGLSGDPSLNLIDSISGRVNAWSKIVDGLASDSWNVRLRLEFQSKYAQHILASFRLSATSSADAPTILATPDHILAIAKKNLEDRSAEESESIADYYRSKIAPSRNQLRTRLSELESALAAMRPRPPSP